MHRMTGKRLIGGLGVALVLAGCASVPTGPSVMVLPGSGRSFDEFRLDEAACRRYALDRTGGTTAQQRARDSAVTSAAVGTVVGAAAGAAIGGQQGAAVGAGTGLLVGGAVGTDTAQQSERGTQRQYDNAYIQCMYAKGHRVPVPTGMATAAPPARSAPGSTGSIPPPPKGLPPAPPADVAR